jgi:hypothetical protein
MFGGAVLSRRKQDRQEEEQRGQNHDAREENHRASPDANGRCRHAKHRATSRKGVPETISVGLPFTRMCRREKPVTSTFSVSGQGHVNVYASAKYGLRQTAYFFRERERNH